MALFAGTALAAALLALRFLRADATADSATLGPWLAATGFVFGVGMTLLTIALSLRRRRDARGLQAQTRTSLTARVAMVALLSVGAMGFITYGLSSRMVEDSVVRRLQDAARLKEALVQSWLEDAHEVLQRWASAPEVLRLVEGWRDGNEHSDAELRLRALLQDHARQHHFRALWICTADCAQPLLAWHDPEMPGGADTRRALTLSARIENARGDLAVRAFVEVRPELVKALDLGALDPSGLETLLVVRDVDALATMGGADGSRLIALDRAGSVDEATHARIGRALKVVDQRQPGLGWLEAIEGTSWLVLAKIDESAAYGEIRRIFGVAAAMTVLILLLAAWWALENDRHVRTANRLLLERADQAQQVAALSRRVASAQELERRRMSAELHDRSGANLAAIQMNLKALERRALGADEDDRELLRETSALLADTVMQIREFCAELRPSTLDQAGLVSAIEAAAERAQRRSGMQVEVDCAGYAEVQPPEVESVLFRIAQEALLNCAKHSKARTIRIQLIAAPGGQVRMTITDDGVGFSSATQRADATNRGQGMLIMNDRAVFADGRLTVNSAPGQGTSVVFERP